MHGLGVRSILETAEHDGQPQRSSIVVCQFGRSAALAGAAGVGPRRSVHSRIATRSRRRNATSRSCLRRRSTDRHASQRDKQVGRTHSRNQDPACIHVRGKGRVAYESSVVIRFLGPCQVAISNPRVLCCGPPTRGPIDRHELDVPANMNRSPVAALEV